MTQLTILLPMAAMFIALGGFLKYYIDAKIDPVRDQVNLLVQYMIQHEGKISRLEERTK